MARAGEFVATDAPHEKVTQPDAPHKKFGAEHFENCAIWQFLRCISVALRFENIEEPGLFAIL